MTPTGWGWVPALVALFALLSDLVKVKSAQREGHVPGSEPGRQERLTKPTGVNDSGRMPNTLDLRWTLMRNLVEDASEAPTQLEALGLLQELVDAARAMQDDVVGQAVAAGSTWTEVAAAAAMTKQGAWARWSPQAAFVEGVKAARDRG